MVSTHPGHCVEQCLVVVVVVAAASAAAALAVVLPKWLQ